MFMSSAQGGVLELKEEVDICPHPSSGAYLQLIATGTGIFSFLQRSFTGKQTTHNDRPHAQQ